MNAHKHIYVRIASLCNGTVCFQYVDDAVVRFRSYKSHFLRYNPTEKDWFTEIILIRLQQSVSYTLLLSLSLSLLRFFCSAPYRFFFFYSKRLSIYQLRNDFPLLQLNPQCNICICQMVYTYTYSIHMEIHTASIGMNKCDDIYAVTMSTAATTNSVFVVVAVQCKKRKHL